MGSFEGEQLIFTPTEGSSLPPFLKGDDFRKKLADAEHVELFQSDITIDTDGTILVHETITIHTKGLQIKKGIFRDFPNSYIDRAGRRTPVHFDISDVTRDEKPEKYSVEKLENGERVKMGDPDVNLVPGDHTYVVTYKVDRTLGFFKDYDELYWNVTGNGWAFRITEASATIHLPHGASLKQYALYTGVTGAIGKDAMETVDPDGAIHFTTTSGLSPGEGLTVAVGFTKGIVIRDVGSTHLSESHLKRGCP